jgi:ATP-dependent protease ClpP protease subunit
MVASAATIVMLGCKERISTKYTSFLVHSVSAFAIGKVNDILEEVDEIKRLQDIIVEIYTANTKLTKEKLEEIDKMKKDWWIGAKEAKSYGLITSIE